MKTESRDILLQFYKDKIVLVTGHTGFKGTWLTRILLNAGAKVIGYSLPAPTNPNLFSIAGFEKYQRSGKFVNVVGDVRDLQELGKIFQEYQPQIVFHLAAQPIVRDSYKEPVYTYETNVMGTVNVLECIRQTESVRSVVVITTDKVYKNNEWIWGYREDEPLDGFDPYSNSKSCAELAVHSYCNSFFSSMDGTVDESTGKQKRYLAVCTARAGNVIGGGDFANDRIIPDCVRACEKALHEGLEEVVIGVRNPYSTRPYQHVLEPLAMYLTMAKAQWEDRSKASCYNVGPDDEDCVTTGELVTLFCDKWNDDHGEAIVSGQEVGSGKNDENGNLYSKVEQANSTNLIQVTNANKFPAARWENRAETNAPHEANFLKLDSTKVKVMLGYHPRWHMDACVEKIVAFCRIYLAEPKKIPEEMDREIEEFFG